MLGARPGPAQPLISSLLAMPFAPPQTPSRGAGSYMGANRTFITLRANDLDGRESEHESDHAAAAFIL